MEYVNMVVLVGYSSEPKIIDSQHGKLAHFGVLTKRYTGKDNEGKAQYVTDAHNCQVTGKLAENLKSGKGDLVYVQGELRANTKDGITYTNVSVKELKVLKKKVRKSNGDMGDFPEEAHE